MAFFKMSLLFLSVIIGLLLLDIAHIYTFKNMYENNINIVTNSNTITYDKTSIIIAYGCLIGIVYMLYLMSKATPFKLSNICIATVLGLFVYGLYNFTNAGTLKNYSKSVAIHDTLWGGCLLGAAGTVFELSKV